MNMNNEYYIKKQVFAEKKETFLMMRTAENWISFLNALCKMASPCD